VGRFGATVRRRLPDSSMFFYLFNSNRGRVRTAVSDHICNPRQYFITHDGCLAFALRRSDGQHGRNLVRHQNHYGMTSSHNGNDKKVKS
jgi:hypothetical protein